MHAFSGVEAEGGMRVQVSSFMHDHFSAEIESSAALPNNAAGPACDVGNVCSFHGFVASGYVQSMPVIHPHPNPYVVNAHRGVSSLCSE